MIALRTIHGGSDQLNGHLEFWACFTKWPSTCETLVKSNFSRKISNDPTVHAKISIPPLSEISQQVLRHSSSWDAEPRVCYTKTIKKTSRHWGAGRVMVYRGGAVGYRGWYWGMGWIGAYGTNTALQICFQKNLNNIYIYIYIYIYISGSCLFKLSQWTHHSAPPLSAQVFPQPAPSRHPFSGMVFSSRRR
jgi:hypothetical protein